MQNKVKLVDKEKSEPLGENCGGSSLMIYNNWVEKEKEVEGLFHLRYGISDSKRNHHTHKVHGLRKGTAQFPNKQDAPV